MEEHDPTAVEPNDLADPSPPVEADLPEQTPPPGFEPQVDLGSGWDPGMEEREGDLIEDTEAEDPDTQDEDDGHADEDDDSAEDDGSD